MNKLKDLRANDWATVPIESGVYWWYFPPDCLEKFRISEFCPGDSLKLHRTDDGKVCLYHGMAKSLSERIKWHAAQKLSLGALSSGFLSTFRFTLLALNDFDYLSGSGEIDAFMDGLDIRWQTTPTEAAADAAETTELLHGPHFPLNIQNNRRPELASYIHHLKSVRKNYKGRYL